MSTTDSPPSDVSWPTAPPGAPGLKIGFPGAHEAATPSRRISRRALILLLAGGLGVVVLIVVALLATPGAAPYCSPLKCQGPPIGHPGEKGFTQSAVGRPVASGILYKSPEGFSLRYVQASRVQEYKNGIELTYAFTSASIGTGYLDVLGETATSSIPSFVASTASKLWGSNATMVYVMPNPLIGYHPAYGEAFNISPASSDGSTQTSRALVAATTYNGYTILVLAEGPLLPTVNSSSPFFDYHPSPANLYMAYFYGTDLLLNSIVFPKE